MSPRPALWFCPSPGTPDWRALSDPSTFALLAADCDALQLYQDQLLDAPMPALGLPRMALPPHGWNTWRAFREWGILSMAAAHNLPIIVESPGLKPWSREPAVYVERILESSRIARDIGGSIDAVAFDEPFLSGFHLSQPAGSLGEVLTHIRTVRDQVWMREPSIGVGLIEAYPTIDATTLCSIVEAFAPAFFHLDIDYRAARQRGSLKVFQADLVRIADCCKMAKVPFGVIIWGYDERSAETFMKSARLLLTAVRKAVIRGDLSWPDRLIVQSWSAAAVLGPRLIPPTLPPDGEASLWGLLRLVKSSL